MNRQDKECWLIQKGMYGRDAITKENIDDLNEIQNEKAKEFLKKYPEAIVGRIGWYRKKDEGFPLLKDHMPLKNFSFNFAIPERVKIIELAIKGWNETKFEATHAVRAIERINTWIANAKGIQFFWL